MNIQKHIIFITTLIFIAFFNVGHAKQFNGFVNLENAELEKTRVNGSAEFTNSKVQSLTVNGSLKFQDLTVSESLQINGAIYGKILRCEQLLVSGSLTGHKLTVSGDTSVSGEITIYDSILQDLNCKSAKILINNTSTKNINVRPSKSKIKQQVVLKGKTIVNGDIVFASGSGEVLLGSQAKITGEVKGGKIYQN